MLRVFLWMIGLGLVMGPGPGVYLVNGAARAGMTMCGVPVLYLWVVFWFGIMALSVLGMYRFCWNEDRSE